MKLKTLALADEQIYQFDLKGYIILKDVVPEIHLKAANLVLDQIEAMAPKDYPPALAFAQDTSLPGMFFTNVLEADPAMRTFMNYPKVLGAIQSVTGPTWRLNHTACIIRHGKGNPTKVHGGATPHDAKCSYEVKDGQIFSSLTKVVYPLLPCRPEDGCFAVIPGSHKSCFPRPWSNEPQDNLELTPVIAEPGDAIVFTEALTHGSTINTSGKSRRTLYYCYSVGHMADWMYHGTKFSPEFYQQVNDTERHILSLK